MSIKKEVFTLKKYDGNAYILDGNVLLTTAIWADESETPTYDNSNWGEVDERAFDTEEEYQEIYDLANDPKERIQLGHEILLSFFSVDETHWAIDDFLFSTTLSEFESVNNYDDLDKDIEKIKKAKQGDTVLVDFQYIVKIAQ